MMADKSQMARKDLGDKVADSVVAGIRSASAVDKWTVRCLVWQRKRHFTYLQRGTRQLDHPHHLQRPNSIPVSC
jgi:hypothetical protein